MELKFGAITDQDIEIIKDTSVNPIRFSDISSHSFFGNPIQLIKLTSILSIVRDRQRIASIVEAVGESPTLRNPVALEILLLNGNPALTSLDDLPDELKVCLLLYFGDAPYSALRFQDVSAVCKVQLIKFAALEGNQALVDFIYDASSPDEREFFTQFHVSLARFAAMFFDRLAVNVDHDKWAGYCRIIAEVLCKSQSESRAFVYACMALLTANKGDLDEAARIIKVREVTDRLLRYSIPMRRSVKDGDFVNAIKFADAMLPFCSPNLAVSEFSRDTAEYALRRVNKLLMAEGLEPFLISGTLLGCIRDGRIFEHDKDFDIGIIGWQRQYDVAAALLKSGEFSFTTKDLRGGKLFLLPVRHIPSGFDFDIFFFHDHGNHFLHGIDSRIGYTINYKFSKFDLISWKFVGDDFLIPRDYEVMLSENYGPLWRVPDPSYFVKLESPALVGGNDSLAGFVARHEMIDLIQKRGSLKKGRALIECIKKNVAKEFQPSKKTFGEFLDAIRRFSQ